MSNSLLNKLKVIDSSRNRLKTILQEKNITVSGNSLPALIEDVNGLYKPDGMPTEWNGLPNPEDVEKTITYYKPGIDFDAIYAADTDKDNYTNVIMWLLKVEDGLMNTVNQDNFCRCEKYKFSDDGVLRNAVNTNPSPSHTWNSENDIIGEDGNHYRWVLGYANSSIEHIYNAQDTMVDGVILYKGTFTNVYVRRRYGGAPAYIEIKDACTLTGALLTDYTDTNTTLRTVICNAAKAGINDNTFNNCEALEFFKITSNFNGTNSLGNTFSNCKSLRYCYFKELYNPWHNTWRYDKDVYIYIGTVTNNLGRNDERYEWSTFSQTEGLKVKIGKVNGCVNCIAWDSDGLAFAKNLEIDIHEVTSNIKPNVFNQFYTQALHVKIDRVGGYIGNSAFLDTRLVGTMELYNGDNAGGTIGNSAFQGTNIKKLIINNPNISSIENNAFQMSDIESIEINAGCAKLGTYIIKDCKNMKNFIFGDTVTSFTENTFRESYVENIVMGTGITSIPNNAFRYTGGLHSITLNEAILSLGTYCFAETKMQSIHLPASVTSISSYCFYESDIEEVISDSPITSIGEGAFQGCYKLTTIDISHLETVGANAFNETNLPIFEIPGTITSYVGTSFTYIHSPVIRFNKDFNVVADLSVTGADLNVNNVLAFLYSLPNGNNYTLTMYPVKANSVTNANRRFYNTISSRKITDTGEGLVWDDNGSQTVAQYVASKNWAIV